MNLSMSFSKDPLTDYTQRVITTLLVRVDLQKTEIIFKRSVFFLIALGAYKITVRARRTGSKLSCEELRQARKGSRRTQGSNWKVWDNRML